MDGPDQGERPWSEQDRFRGTCARENAEWSGSEGVKQLHLHITEQASFGRPHSNSAYDAAFPQHRYCKNCAEPRKLSDKSFSG
jgi:hypothetical protein